jgi:hypothetical protein
MILARRRRHLLSIGAVAVLLAGCGGSSAANRFTPLVPSLRQSAPSTHALPGVPVGWPKNKHEAILFAADGSAGLLMFDPNKADGSPIGSITAGIDGTAGVAVDAKSTLYVVNSSGDTVTVYPRGQTSPKYTINSGLSIPYGIGIDSKGNVFVSSILYDTVTAYHAGQTTPYETIDFDNYGAVMGVGVDGKDNVWVVSDYGPPYDVFEIPAGTTRVENANLQDLNVPIGIAFGENDETYVSNLESSVVNVYEYGSTKPFKTITDGIEHYGATLNAVTSSGRYYQANQIENVVGYRKNRSKPFSTLKVTEPLGLASWPLVEK